MNRNKGTARSDKEYSEFPSFLANVALRLEIWSTINFLNLTIELRFPKTITKNYRSQILKINLFFEVFDICPILVYSSSTKFNCSNSFYKF